MHVRWERAFDQLIIEYPGLGPVAITREMIEDVMPARAGNSLPTKARIALEHAKIVIEALQDAGKVHAEDVVRGINEALR